MYSVSPSPPDPSAGLDTPDRGVRAPSLQPIYAALQACETCADALVDRADRRFLQGLRLVQDCVAVCAAAGAVAGRTSGSNEPVALGLLMICEALCRDTALECDLIAADVLQAGACSEACRRCEAFCAEMRSKMSSAPVQ